MISVPLSFVPPTDPDMATLLIYEGSSSAGPFTEIDSTSDIGTYPDYINRYVTQQAQNATDWFMIQWVDSEGAASLFSAPMQGGSQTLIGELVSRVLIRMAGLIEAVVVQEAEDVVAFCFDVSDPYSVELTSVSRLWLAELANLVYAAVLYINIITQTSQQGYSAGVISQSTFSGSKDALDALERMEQRALQRMGIGGSRIARFDHHGHWRDRYFNVEGVGTITSATRLFSTTALTTKRIVVRDIPTGFVISRR